MLQRVPKGESRELEDTGKLGKARRIKKKRIVEELLERHPDRFTTNFEENKKILEELMVVPSKTIRNEIAGCLTSSLNKQSEGE